MGKRQKFVITILSSLMMTTATFAADQGHGTVKFTGSIVDAPCSITPTTADQTVDLGAASVKSLESGASSTPTRFNIQLENCDLSTPATVSALFTGTPAANNKDSLGITGTAAGAAIALKDATGNPIKLGTATTAQNLTLVNNTLEFSASLEKDGASATITPGDYSSEVNFTLSYP